MKGKTVFILIMVLLVVLFYVNIGAFTVTEVSQDYLDMTHGSPDSMLVGEVFSWANAAVWSGGLFIIPVIFLFWLIDTIFLSSYIKKNAVWKKIVTIIFSMIVLLLSFVQIILLAMATGKQYIGGHYMFSIGPTGTIVILYVAVLSLIGSALWMVIERFMLPKSMNKTAAAMKPEIETGS